MPTLSLGVLTADHPGDPLHHVFGRLLVAARADVVGGEPVEEHGFGELAGVVGGVVVPVDGEGAGALLEDVVGGHVAGG